MPDKDATPKPTPAGHPENRFGQTPGAGDWKRISRSVALIVLVVYAVLFFLWNRDTVTVSLVVTTVSIPLVWTLLLSFVLGAAVMYLLTFLRRRAAKKTR